jgi:thiamine-phosphate pyrophosphorylase
MKADIRLYALVDPQRSGGHALPDLARRVVDGGATLVQLRDKLGSTRDMVERARAIKAALAGTGTRLLVNDRVDVALAAGADGVHVGQDDMAAPDARSLLGAEATIGLSVKTAAQAADAPLEALDYICIGGVFATTSKDNTSAPIGVAGLRSILAALRARSGDLPVGAIAGIDASNAADVIAAGADGVAVIAALSLAPDPEAAARELRAIVDRARASRR